ncbi:MAG: DUF1772 domain-containing protein [Azospirillaceae bacterium]
MASVVMFVQFLAALLFSMVAGSVFGIWRGYDPTTYAAATFLEMHQGAVRGLNALLPGLALVSILLTLALTWLARGKGVVFWLYLGALLLMVGGGVVTRFFNQPINAHVMGWTLDSLPANWADLRAAWWNWHLVRTGLSIVAIALLLAAIIVDRPSPS